MEFPLQFPRDGVNLNFAVGTQPPTTTGNAQNVGLLDPYDLRERGAQRHGLTRLVPLALGPAPVRDLNQIVTDVPRVIYSQSGTADTDPVTELWSISPERGVFVASIAVDLGEIVYAWTSVGSLFVLDKNGNLEQSFSVTAAQGYDALPRIVIDEIGGIIVAVSKATETKIFRVRRVSQDRGSYDLHWTVTVASRQGYDFDARDGSLMLTSTAGGVDHRLTKFVDIFSTAPVQLWDVQASATANKPYKVRIGSQGAAYLCLSPDSGTAPFRVTKWYPHGLKAWATDAVGGGLGAGIALTPEDDVITVGPKLAGVGLSGADESDVVIRKLIDLGTSFSADEHTAAAGTLTLPAAIADGLTVTIGLRDYTWRAALTAGVEDEVKVAGTAVGNAANFTAAINHAAGGGTTYSDATRLNAEVVAADLGGGQVLVTAKVRGSSGNAIPTTTSVPGATWTGAFLSGGTDNPAGFGAWTGTDPEDIYSGNPGLSSSADVKLDSVGDVYAGVNTIDAAFESFEKRGGQHGYTIMQHRLTEISISEFVRGLALASIEPIYHTTSISGPRFVYLGTTSSGGTPNLHKVEIVRLVSDAGADATTRLHVGVGVCNGNVVTFTPGGSPTNPTGGIGVIDPTSPYVQSAVILGKLYLIDGVNYLRYNPEGFDEDPRRDIVEPWPVDRGRGQLPENCRLLSAWNDCAVLARPTDDPHQWFLSGKGKPSDWLVYSADQFETDAVIGSDSRAGPCPDVINAIIPWTTDRLIFGGDHTLHVLSGHPRVNGVFDLISNSTGIAFGSPFCQDPRGNIYFFGSRGGVWALPPGGAPFDITEQNIYSALLAVDLAAFKPIMAWNTELSTLHLYFASYTGTGSSVQHWRWERRRGWWPDRFSDANLEPTSVAVIDGDDPNDRRVILGCKDGVVRYIDRLAVNDDGFRIESFVDMGPYATDGELLFKGLEAILSSRQDGCDFEWFVGDEPDNLTSRYRGRFHPGRNPMLRHRARGSYCVLRLYSASQAERWALESVTADAENIRVRRQRA